MTRHSASRRRSAARASRRSAVRSTRRPACRTNSARMHCVSQRTWPKSTWSSPAIASGARTTKACRRPSAEHVQAAAAATRGTTGRPTKTAHRAVSDRLRSPRRRDPKTAPAHRNRYQGARKAARRGRRTAHAGTAARLEAVEVASGNTLRWRRPAGASSRIIRASVMRGEQFAKLRTTCLPLFLCVLVLGQCFALEAQHHEHRSDEHCCLLCHTGPHATLDTVPLVFDAPEFATAWTAATFQSPAPAQAPVLHFASRAPPSVSCS